MDYAHIRDVARIMDNLVRIPGTKIHIGLDSILGIVPGVGDILAILPSLYIIYLSHRAGVQRALLGRMLVNVGIDVVVGSIPLIGDVFDIFWKANERNVRLLEDR